MQKDGITGHMLRHKNTNRLYDHWAQKRHHGEPPQRDKIEPSAIAPALGNSAILEHQSSGLYIFRLAGSRLAAIFGHEMTGDPVTDLFCTPDHKMITQGMNAVAQEHAAMIIETAGFTQTGRVVAFECIFLPVLDARPSIVAAIQNMTTPVWLGSEPVLAMEVRSLRMMDFDRELFALDNRPSILFPADRHNASSIASIDAHKTRPSLAVIAGQGTGQKNRAPAQLRVVEGGKP